MIALADCNNFFVSCERVRHPDLAGMPVVVLGSNDGCVVAMSNEAKALGITRGVPMFKIRDIVKRHDVRTLSGDHRYYSYTSSKVMAHIKSLVEQVDVYSIDEAFLRIPFTGESLHEFGHYVVESVMNATGIPISLGASTTPTLAKLAAHFAKRYSGYKGVCLIDSDAKRSKALEITPLKDIWGIGRKTSASLAKVGITYASQFAALQLERISARYSITTQRIWRELNGEHCIDTSARKDSHKSITCSRSFAHDVFSRDEIYEAISDYAASAARRLRKSGHYAEEVTVFAATNPYHNHLTQFSGEIRKKLDEPTNDSMKIISAAHKALSELYREGYGYKRAGVTLSHITNGAGQASLFTDFEGSKRRSRLMSVIDTINSSDKTGSIVKIASMSTKRNEKTDHKITK